MKFILYLFLILLCTQAFSQKKRDYVFIDYVDLEVLTTKKISCADFEKSFKDDFKEIEVKDILEKQKIIDLAKSLKGNYTNNTPDVRIRVEIYINNKLSSLCIDHNTMEYKGVCVKFNKELFDLINEIIKRETLY